MAKIEDAKLLRALIFRTSREGEKRSPKRTSLTIDEILQQQLFRSKPFPNIIYSNYYFQNSIPLFQFACSTLSPRVVLAFINAIQRKGDRNPLIWLTNENESILQYVLRWHKDWSKPIYAILFILAKE